MGPLFALTTLLSAVLLESASAECTFEFITQLVPHYNRQLQPVPHDLGTLNNLVSTDCDPDVDSGPLGICLDPDLEELFTAHESLADAVAHADYLDDTRSWGNYFEALLIWFLSCLNIAAVTVFCLWPGCCCFCCCAHRCSPSGRWKTREKFQTCLLVAFMVLVASLIFVGHMGNIGLTHGQLALVEKPVSTLTKMMRSLPATSGKFVLDMVGRTFVKFLDVGNATFHEYIRPEQLNRSLYCAQDGLWIAQEVMQSLSDIVDDLKAAMATLPSKESQESGLLTEVLATLQANVSGIVTVLETLSLARPLLVEELAAVTDAVNSMASEFEELKSTLKAARSSAGAISALRDESSSFNVTAASADEKEAHVRRLKVLLKKVPNVLELAETLTSLNYLLGNSTQRVGVVLDKWQALNATISGRSGPLKEMPSADVLDDTIWSIDEALTVLHTLDTSSVRQVIEKLQEADVASFAEQAQLLKDNINCTLEAKVCLQGAVEFLGEHPLVEDVQGVAVLLETMVHHLGGELPDFNELSEKLKEVSSPSALTPEVKQFLDQAGVLEKEVATVVKEWDEVDWQKLFDVGQMREKLSDDQVFDKVKQLEEALAEPVLHIEVSVVKEFDLADLDKALELMLKYRNFDHLPELHEKIETQLPNTTDFKKLALRCIIRTTGAATAGTEAEEMRKVIEGIPDFKEAIEGLKTLEGAVKKVPDPRSFTDHVGKLFSGVAYLKQHTEDFSKMVTDAGKAVEELPREHFAQLANGMKNILVFTGSHFTEEGSLAWLMDQWSVPSLQQTMEEEGLMQMLWKVHRSMLTSAHFVGIPMKDTLWPDLVRKGLVEFVNALEDRPARGGKPSENGALWYILNVLGHQEHGQDPSHWLKPQEAFAALGERALVTGYLHEGRLLPYRGPQGTHNALYCFTKDCLENTVRIVNKGDVFPLVADAPEFEGVHAQLPSREMMTAGNFIWPIILIILSGLVLATRAKCLSCCLLFVALIYLPILMMIMALLVPASTFGADICGSTGSMSVRMATVIAPVFCNSFHGAFFHGPTRMCYLYENEESMKFNMEEVVHSIVDRCAGRSKPGVEAVADFWEEAARSVKAQFNGYTKDARITLGPPAHTIVTDLMGNATEDMKTAILKLGKTVDCEALNDIYEDIKDSMCCQVGGHIYLFVMAGYLIGMCIIYCAIPGGAIGMMSKVEPPRRETQFVGPDGRMHVDNRDMVEMGRL